MERARERARESEMEMRWGRGEDAQARDEKGTESGRRN